MEQTLVSPAIENYLKAIYLLQARTGKPAPISRVAERLAVAPASVTEMVQRLAREGLVKHVRYRGVSLTERGRQAALAVVRRHRLLETFLVSELGMDWAEVHEEAEALEHSISGRLVAAIAAKLGEPSRDPHGDPIPSAELEIDEAETVPVDQLPLGAKGHLVRILDADSELLAYLDRLDIRLGDEVEVLALEPFGGPYTVSFSGRSRSLGRLAAGSLAVEVN